MKLSLGLLGLTLGAVAMANPISGKFESNVSHLVTVAAHCASELEIAVEDGATAGTVTWLADRRGYRYTVPFLSGGKVQSTLRMANLRGLPLQCQLDR